MGRAGKKKTEGAVGSTKKGVPHPARGCQTLPERKDAYAEKKHEV